MGQGRGGMLALAGLFALFSAPVLMFYFMANLSWRGQQLQHDRAIDGAGRNPFLRA